MPDIEHAAVYRLLLLSVCLSVSHVSFIKGSTYAYFRNKAQQCEYAQKTFKMRRPPFKKPQIKVIL
jgi:hypothetical protein